MCKVFNTKPAYCKEAYGFYLRRGGIGRKHAVNKNKIFSVKKNRQVIKESAIKKSQRLQGYDQEGSHYNKGVDFLNFNLLMHKITPNRSSL